MSKPFAARAHRRCSLVHVVNLPLRQSCPRARCGSIWAAISTECAVSRELRQIKAGSLWTLGAFCADDARVLLDCTKPVQPGTSVKGFDSTR